MDIRSCYEAGAVLFWLLFAYLFMDKFLFRGQLGEICFGKARRRMAKALRGAAGWFDPVKEERKKGRGQAKGKTGRKEIPAVVKTQEKELPPVKAEMKPTEKTAERNSEKTVGKQPGKSRKTKCDGREKRKAIFEAKTKCAQKSRLLPPSGQNTSVVQTPFESCLNDAFLLNFPLKYHLKPIANLTKNRIFI